VWWFSRWITLPLGVLGGTVVFVLMALTIIDVALRTANGQGIAGVVEYSEVFLVIAVFAAIAAAQVRGFHVATSGLMSRLPRQPRRIVEAVGALLGFLVIGIMAVVAVFAAANSIESGEYRMGIAHVLVWPARVAVAVGFVVYAVEFVHGAIRHFIDPDEDVDDALDPLATGAVL
jgi:TRAP-type C4-dicarboxylate transport system permease small subunit